jgi:hypothetical protein
MVTKTIIFNEGSGTNNGAIAFGSKTTTNILSLLSIVPVLQPIKTAKTIPNSTTNFFHSRFYFKDKTFYCR